MLNRTGVIFCSVSLATAVAVCAAGFSLAAMPSDAVSAAKVPVPPESLPDLELPGFGKVAVLDLMGYYIENPPAPASASGGSAPAPRRFGGC